MIDICLSDENGKDLVKYKSNHIPRIGDLFHLGSTGTCEVLDVVWNVSDKDGLQGVDVVLRY